MKRYTQPVVQTQPGPEFKIAEVPLFEDPKGKWVKWEDVEKMCEALKVTHQALIEVNHAQEVGTSWYTRGESGLRSQVAMWVRKGLDAARTVLESERS